jgi:hypothetical protein
MYSFNDVTPKVNPKTCKHDKGYWRMTYFKGWYRYDASGNFTGESSVNGDDLVKTGKSKHCVLCDKKI